MVEIVRGLSPSLLVAGTEAETMVKEADWRGIRCDMVVKRRGTVKVVMLRFAISVTRRAVGCDDEARQGKGKNRPGKVTVLPAHSKVVEHMPAKVRGTHFTVFAQCRTQYLSHDVHGESFRENKTVMAYNSFKTAQTNGIRKTC